LGASGLCRLARCPLGLEALGAGPIRWIVAFLRWAWGLMCGPDMLDCRFAPLGL
jgi:hypothetical protein